MDEGLEQKKNERYKNWIKAGLGLRYLKDGLECFCDELVEKQHCDLIKTVEEKTKLTNIHCERCSVNNLQPNHVKVKGKCPLLHVKCNCLYPAGKVMCPNNVCSLIYDEIIKLHASHPPCPNWKNTDSKGWCTDPWSVARCFVNAPGYDGKNSASEIDCAGLLHVIINSKGSHSTLTFASSGRNVFAQALHSRNLILHSAKMELSDEEVNEHIENMIDVLKECPELNAREEAMVAIQKLLQIQDQDITFSTQTEGEIVQASKSAIELRMKNMEEKVIELQNDLADIRNAHVFQQEHLCYVKEKQVFQQSLIDLYMERVVKVSPLPFQHDRHCTSIDKLYASPWMTFALTEEIEDRDGRNSSQSRNVLVKSANDIFYKRGRKSLNIYIFGEAGSGKSAFCKYIVHAWCSTHSQERQNDDQTLDVRDSLKDFDFLFFISLRHNTHHCSIKSMLQEHYGEPILDQILEKDSATCLILMDGLDEWSKPSTQEMTPQFQTAGVPDRNYIKRYTVMTTSRPWKMESLNLTNSEQNHIIKLRGIDNDTVSDMSKRYIDELIKVSGKTKSYQSVMNVVMYSQLSDMKNVPVILQQLICLSFDDRLPSTSTCAIYRSMLDLMIEWAIKRNLSDRDFEEVAKMSMRRENIDQRQAKKNTDFIEKYSAVVSFVSKLAFKTLFSNKKDTTICFSRSALTELDIPDTVERCCIKIGILTEEQSVSILPSRQNISSFAFMHKSMQEFLAALYIESERKTSMKRQQCVSGFIGGRFQACKHYVNELFKCLESTEDVLNFSNVIIMLCGLDTALTVHISDMIYAILRNDVRITRYVETVQKPSDCKVISDIQKLTFRYMKEHLANGSNLAPLILENLTFDKGTWKVALLKYVDPMKIVSLGICLSRESEPAKIKTLFEYLNECKQIKKVYISDQWGKIDSELSNLERLIVNNIGTLQCISLKLSRYVDKNPLAEAIIDHIPHMTRLRSLKLSGISLSQSQCGTLSTFFTDTTHLQQIALKWIECKDLRAKIDFFRHENLQYLKTMGETFDIKAINLQNLETFTMNRTFENTLMNSLCQLENAPKLKYLSLGALFIKTDHDNITSKLLLLLQSLPALTTLKLEYFTFQDKFLSAPDTLKHMKTIKLFGVQMKQDTWRKFVESLLLMPNKIQVQTRSLEITTTEDKWSFKEHMKELRDKFEIIFDSGVFFHFKMK